MVLDEDDGRGYEVSMSRCACVFSVSKYLQGPNLYCRFPFHMDKAIRAERHDWDNNHNNKLKQLNRINNFSLHDDDDGNDNRQRELYRPCQRTRFSEPLNFVYELRPWGNCDIVCGDSIFELRRRRRRRRKGQAGRETVVVDWVNIDMLYTQVKGQVRQEKNIHTHSSCWLTAAAAAKINNTEGALEITEKREFSLSPFSSSSISFLVSSCVREPHKEKKRQ